MKVFNFRKHFNSELQNPIVNSTPVQTSDSRIVRQYTKDLTQLEKKDLKASFRDDFTCEVFFEKHPTLAFTIRRQNIFDSGAQVIVNAANTHLGGGGGIDGAIHKKGGQDYAKAHQELQRLYESQYIPGHAAMIESGALKKDHEIDHVIVVAGPQGEVDPEKENELYSCYYNSLVLAQSQHKTSIAFPSISTGIFGFDKGRAAAISTKAVFDFINQYPDTTLKTISIHILPSDPKSDLEIYRIAV